MRNEKITPLYERLSRDDELQGESNSKMCIRDRWKISEDRSAACFSGSADAAFFSCTLRICQPAWSGSVFRLRCSLQDR